MTTATWTPGALASPGSRSYRSNPTSLRLLHTPSPPIDLPPADPPSRPANHRKATQIRRAPKQLAILYYQKCQEAQSLKEDLDNLRDALLMKIRELKTQI